MSVLWWLGGAKNLGSREVGRGELVETKRQD